MIFVKIGGSLITDKTTERSYYAQTTERIAQEIVEAKQQNPSLRLLIGHGSGSFGHFAAQRHNTINGVSTAHDWVGFAEVATTAAELNHKVTTAFHNAGLPVWRLQPSASAICENGAIREMAITPIQTALKNGLLPLVHGDVAIDTQKGGTIISTETIFKYLAHHLTVKRIILLGEVDGVYDDSGTVIPQITPQTYPQVKSALGNSRGIDVTGGMLTKVQDMLSLARDVNGAVIHIINGNQPDLLTHVLLDDALQVGTRIFTPHQKLT
jgi:isopentenyl phosphate kinase